MERRLQGLDALRGVAALSVFGLHLQVIYFGTSSDAFLAVDFFFMLSGYIMARLLKENPQPATNFAWKRYKRFWPTMAIGTALGFFGATAEGNVPAPMVLLASVLLIPSLHGAVFPLNGPMWSIFFELVANSSHPLLNRKSFVIVFVVSFLTMLACIAVMNSYSVGHRAFFFGFGRTFLAYSIGALLYDRWRDEPPFRVPFWIGCMLICVPLLFTAPGIFGLFYVVAICPVILASAFTAEPVWSKFAGDLSFPFYAVHLPILLTAAHFGLSPVLATATAVMVALFAAWLLTPRSSKSAGDVLGSAEGSLSHP